MCKHNVQRGFFTYFDMYWVVHGCPWGAVPCSGRDVLEVRRVGNTCGLPLAHRKPLFAMASLNLMRHIPWYTLEDPISFKPRWRQRARTEKQVGPPRPVWGVWGYFEGCNLDPPIRSGAHGFYPPQFHCFHLNLVSKIFSF